MSLGLKEDPDENYSCLFRREKENREQVSLYASKSDHEVENKAQLEELILPFRKLTSEITCRGLRYGQHVSETTPLGISKL